MSEEKKEFKPLNLTNHASQILREFLKRKDKDKTNYTATDLYEVLEMSENKFRQQINEVIEGLLKEIELRAFVYRLESTSMYVHCLDTNPLVVYLDKVIELIKKFFPDEVREYE